MVESSLEEVADLVAALSHHKGKLLAILSTFDYLRGCRTMSEGGQR